jgi:hypothetical protein
LSLYAENFVYFDDPAALIFDALALEGIGGAVQSIQWADEVERVLALVDTR